MPAAVTARCSRCGHEPTHLAKPYAAWRLAIRRGPAWQGLVVVVYNLLVAVFVPRRPVCTWCHARRTPRAQHSYGFDPFVHYTRHSREAMVLRRRAAALRPHPSTGRWDPGDRAEILAYLASRDEGRCGLCALPLPVAEGQVEHVVPKKFGLFDFSGGSARAGRTLESMLHHVDNLQMAHDYCNRAKGNTPSAVKWRHPMLPPLPVARQVGNPRTNLWVPERDRDRGTPAAPTPAGTSASPSPVGATARPASGIKRGIRTVLYALSALLALSALTYGLQNGTPFGVAWMLFLAFVFGAVAWRLGASPRAGRGGSAGERSHSRNRTARTRPRRVSQSSGGRKLVGAAVMIAAGLVGLFVLMSVFDRDADDARPSGAAAPPAPALPSSPALAEGPAPAVAAATPGPPPPPDPPPTAVPAPANSSPAQLDSTPATSPAPPPDELAETDPAKGPTTTSTEAPRRHEVHLVDPPADWVPVVDGNTSTFGKPDRRELQWVAWQPGCVSCEPGATLSWVGSYAHPFNGNVFGTAERPKLESACLHRVRSGPLVDWGRDVSDDAVEAIWVDGESAPPGSWWLHEQNNRVMIPEPAPFIELLQEVQQIRVLTAGGHDATFDVAGFLTSAVQANLDHCGFYP